MLGRVYGTGTRCIFGGRTVFTVVSGAGIEAVPDLAEDLGRVVPEKIRPVYFGTCPNALYPMIPCYLPPLRVDCTRRAQSSTQLEFRVVCPP